jgi:hypothetical protein
VGGQDGSCPPALANRTRSPPVIRLPPADLGEPAKLPVGEERGVVPAYVLQALPRPRGLAASPLDHLRGHRTRCLSMCRAREYICWPIYAGCGRGPRRLGTAQPNRRGDFLLVECCLRAPSGTSASRHRGRNLTPHLDGSSATNPSRRAPVSPLARRGRENSATMCWGRPEGLGPEPRKAKRCLSPTRSLVTH